MLYPEAVFHRRKNFIKNESNLKLYQKSNSNKGDPVNIKNFFRRAFYIEHPRWPLLYTERNFLNLFFWEVKPTHPEHFKKFY